MRNLSKTIFTSVCLMALATTAYAQSADDPNDQPVPKDEARDQAADDTQTAPPTPDESLPQPQSDYDPAPPVAAPSAALPPGGIVEQAGVGGVVGYGRAGVLELGGSAGLMVASDVSNVNVSPSIGWFVADNLQLSAILSMSYLEAYGEDATLFSGLIEPSYHLPFNRTMFGFVGMGIGAAYLDEEGAGFAVAPRIGANFLVGRSGILSPSLSYEYTTHDIDTVDTGDMQQTSVVAVSSALRFNVGYTVMW